MHVTVGYRPVDLRGLKCSEYRSWDGHILKVYREYNFVLLYECLVIVKVVYVYNDTNDHDD